MDERGEDEAELAGRQPTALYPIGRALRATYDAENHDSLGNDLTGLMLTLARVEPPGEAPAVPPAPAPPARPVAAAHGDSWLERLVRRLLPPSTAGR